MTPPAPEREPRPSAPDPEGEHARSAPPDDDVPAAASGPASVDIELHGAGGPAPARGTPPRYTGRAARSSLRRYPRAIARSLVERGESSPRRRPPRPGDHPRGRVDARVPEHLVPLAPDDVEAELERLAAAAFGAAWLGHATTLLRLGAHLVLCDPVLSERIGLRLGRLVVGKHRLAPAPAQAAELPGPDLVLVTHAHFDHLDRPTLARLAHPGRTLVTARGTRSLVPPGFRKVIEIDWGETLRFGDLKVHALRPAHWGARTLLDRHRGFNSYLLETRHHRVLFAGDTARTDAFDHLSGVDLAVMGIGAYDPWEAAHATPEQVWRMFAATGGTRLLPMHHATFELSDEPIAEPMERLLRAAGDETDRVLRLAPGQAWTAGEAADA